MKTKNIKRCAAFDPHNGNLFWVDVRCDGLKNGTLRRLNEILPDDWEFIGKMDRDLFRYGTKALWNKT